MVTESRSDPCARSDSEMSIPFVPRIDDAPYGTVEQVAPLIQRVIARNPSKFTYHGTGTYILGTDRVVVIDPGPLLDSHRDALTGALRGRTVVGIVVTHCHSDHSPLAGWLRDHTGAPTIAIGPHGEYPGWVEEDDHDPSEDEPEEADEKADTEEEERESHDSAFLPDVTVRDGEEFLVTDEFRLVAVHTPGHTSNHLCVAMQPGDVLFTGDHVMGWSTSVVGPPDGDMRAYMESLRKVMDRNAAVLWPTHGGAVTDPRPYLRALLAHRLERERQIVEQVAAGNGTIPGIVKVLYANVHKRLHRPARRSVWSHVRKLVDDGVLVTVDGGEPRLLGEYAPAPRD